MSSSMDLIRGTIFDYVIHFRMAKAHEHPICYRVCEEAWREVALGSFDSPRPQTWWNCRKKLLNDRNGRRQLIVVLVQVSSLLLLRPVGRGGSRGFARTPLLASKRFYMHRLTVHFECPTVRNWFSCFHSMNHHRPKKFVNGGPACVSCLHRCNERTHVNTRINKSLFQALKSLPVVLQMISPHLMFYQP